MRIKLLTLCFVFLLGAITVPAQQTPAPVPPPTQDQPPITFKVEVNYVEIDALVTDERGNFVRDLTAADFQIVEDGKPQTISAFSIVNLPVERPDPPLFSRSPIEPDVRTNREEFNGRVFVLVMDDLNTHWQRTSRVRAAAKQFIARYLGANDLVAVVHTGGNVSGAQEFTSSPRLLTRAVEAFTGRKARSATLEKLDDYNRNRGLPDTGPPRDFSEQERAYNARNTLATLKNVAEYMAGIRGRRKAVVYFSEGIDYDTTNPIQNRWASEILEETRRAVAEATRGNVSFYSVDPRGLSGFEDTIEMSGAFPEDNSLGPMNLMDEVRRSQDSLRVIAEETGGFAAINRNDFRETFARIIQDNSTYYVLGYYPSNDRRDGRFRAVDVRVTRPGLRVRARKGYVAPRGRAAEPRSFASTGTSAALRDALNSPVPVSGLGLTVTAASFKGPAPNASVAVILEVDGRKLKFVEKDGTFANDVEISLVAVDSGGKGRDGGRDIAKLGLRPQTHELVMRRGIRLTRRLELKPGRYQLRVGARESGGAVGSIAYDLEVPDFSNPGLSISSIVLTSPWASQLPTANPDADLKGVLPAPPTAIRDFPRSDTIALFAEIYDNDARAAHTVAITTSVLADDGKVVYSMADERKSEELAGAKRGGYGYTGNVPLQNLAPGRYVLRVEARSTLGGGEPVRRELEFRVRP
jgi:VWFA-related protein